MVYGMKITFKLEGDKVIQTTEGEPIVLNGFSDGQVNKMIDKAFDKAIKEAILMNELELLKLINEASNNEITDSELYKIVRHKLNFYNYQFILKKLKDEGMILERCELLEISDISSSTFTAPCLSAIKWFYRITNYGKSILSKEAKHK